MRSAVCHSHALKGSKDSQARNETRDVNKIVSVFETVVNFAACYR